MSELASLRARIDEAKYTGEECTLARLAALADLSGADRARIGEQAAGLVRDIRAGSRPGLMEVLLV